MREMCLARLCYSSGFEKIISYVARNETNKTNRASHLPPTYDNNKDASPASPPPSRVAGLGMNAAELAQNKQLTECVLLSPSGG